jgi:hypothetical protein
MNGETSHRDGISRRLSDMSCPFGTARASLLDTFLADFLSLRIFSKGNASTISVGFRAPLGRFAANFG